MTSLRLKLVMSASAKKKSEKAKKNERSKLRMCSRNICLQFLSINLLTFLKSLKKEKQEKQNLPKPLMLWMPQSMNWIIRKTGKDGQKNFYARKKDLYLMIFQN